MVGEDSSSAPSSLRATHRSEEHTSELQSLMRHSYAVFCLKKKITKNLIISRIINTLTCLNIKTTLVCYVVNVDTNEANPTKKYIETQQGQYSQPNHHTTNNEIQHTHIASTNTQTLQ